MKNAKAMVFLRRYECLTWSKRCGFVVLFTYSWAIVAPLREH
jgi:hypothetical protein